MTPMSRWLRYLPVVAALALVLAPTIDARARQTPVAAPAKDATTLFRQAIELHQAGDVLGAIESYKAVLNLEPAHAGARSNLGAAYVRLGRYADAVEQYQQALAVDKDNPTFRFNLGLAFYKSARMTEAAAELSQVIERQPDHRNARLVLADCHLQLGRFQQVVDVLASFETMYGEDRAFAYILGSAYIETDRADDGQRLIDRIFAAGTTAESRLLLATARMRGGDYPAAVAELRDAAKLNPQLPVVHSLLGRALLRTGDQAGAAQAFMRELAVNPNDFHANLELAELRKRDQQFDEAETYVRRALRIRPNDAASRFSLAGVYVSTGKTDDALGLLEAIVKDEPKFREAYVLLATVYYRLQRREDGDRMRAIVERLNAEAQAKRPGLR